MIPLLLELWFDIKKEITILMKVELKGKLVLWFDIKKEITILTDNIIRKLW